MLKFVPSSKFLQSSSSWANQKMRSTKKKESMTGKMSIYRQVLLIYQNVDARSRSAIWGFRNQLFSCFTELFRRFYIEHVRRTSVMLWWKGKLCLIAANYNISRHADRKPSNQSYGFNPSWGAMTNIKSANKILIFIPKQIQLPPIFS